MALPGRANGLACVFVGKTMNYTIKVYRVFSISDSIVNTESNPGSAGYQHNGDTYYGPFATYSIALKIFTYTC